MRIGVDVSQIAYGNTGVANYILSLVGEMVKSQKHEFVLFFSSLRRYFPSDFEKNLSRDNVQIKKFRMPPTFLNLLWNRLHIAPIEWFIGDVDVFITSDWTEPPAKKAKKATVIYDMVIYKYPEETHKEIINTQRGKLKWVRKESDIIFTISESSKKDIIEILGIPEEKIKVIYPGIGK